MSDSSKKSISQQIFGKAGKKDTSRSIDDVQDDIVYTVEEDRGYLLFSAILRLLGVFAGLFLSLLMWVGAHRTGNVVFLIAFIIGLTVSWFFAKGLGKKSGRLISQVPVVSFGKDNLFLFEKAERKYPLIIAYTDVSAYKMIRQGNALQLLLSGSWVEHPSGFYLVSINRPFMKATISEVQDQIENILRDKNIKEIVA